MHLAMCLDSMITIIAAYQSFWYTSFGLSLVLLAVSMNPLLTMHLTEHLLSVHDLVSAELAPGKSSNAVHHHQFDVVINDAGLQSLHSPIIILIYRCSSRC